MKNFTSVKDVADIEKLIDLAAEMKANPMEYADIGKNKTIVLLFFNPSLRTRISTQKAAYSLGMQVISLDTNSGWKIEFEEDIIMNTDKAEHIREAAQVVSSYADIIGIRSFPSLVDRESDYADSVLKKFIEFATVPIVSLESSILHPLQSLADMLTIKEKKTIIRPKVVLTWAPHPRALPQAVANSFAEWVQKTEVDFVITHPKGYELSEEFVGNAKIEYNQDHAFKDADFVYAKNWSSYEDYGKNLNQDSNWHVCKTKMSKTHNGHFMHCLPIRRNVVASDEVLNSSRSLVIEQANNRTYAAQAVLYSLLKNKI